MSQDRSLTGSGSWRRREESSPPSSPAGQLFSSLQFSRHQEISLISPLPDLRKFILSCNGTWVYFTVFMYSFCAAEILDMKLFISVFIRQRWECQIPLYESVSINRIEKTKRYWQKKIQKYKKRNHLFTMAHSFCRPEVALSPSRNHLKIK